MERGQRYLTQLLSLLLSTVAPISAVAQTYGKVGAVNQNATGTSAGGDTHALTVGANVIHKERIQTSSNGSTQLLFPDQSTLNIGNNSNIVIDEFVYDPNARTGKMVASATKGVLRYVGGQISHSAGATINTPIASLGIRGGIVTIMLPVPSNIAATDPRLAGQGQLVICHFGATTLNTAGGTITLRPGFAVIINAANQAISPPFRPSNATLQLITHALHSHPGQTGGVNHANVPTNRTFAGQQPGVTNPPNSQQAHGSGGGGQGGSGPPGSDPLGYTSIFGGGNSAATGKSQSAPPYP